MRKLALVLAVGVAALGVAGWAQSSGSSSQSAPLDSVWGGGQFTFFLNGVRRDFSIDAHGIPDATAGGVITYGSIGRPLHVRVEISCVRASGNKAVAGGVVTETADGSAVGLKAVFYVVDNGPPASGVRDQVSALFLDDPNAPDARLAGLPKRCPAAEKPDDFAPFQDLEAGDAVVHDGFTKG